MSYKHYPNTLSDGERGSYSAEDVRRGLIGLHTDYTCSFCGKVQSVPQMGGYGGRCIKCGESIDPARQAAKAGGE
jgi:transcription elongation factor Elf1